METKQKSYLIKRKNGELIRIQRDRRRCKGCRKNFTEIEMLSRDVEDYCYLCQLNDGLKDK